MLKIREKGEEIMVWHVHRKNGKYNIWSTIIDAYVLSEWVDEDIVIEVYKEKAIERAIDVAKKNIDRAKEFGCSAMEPLRCEEFVKRKKK